MNAVTPIEPAVFMPRPSPVYAEGAVWIVDAAPGEDPEAAGWYLHPGVRSGIYRHPRDAGALIVHLVGGERREPGYEEEAVTFRARASCLRGLAADLIAAADWLDADQLRKSA